jgi:hypothetical protein
MEEIEHLRKKAADVDGIGRCDVKFLAKFDIGKCLFDKTLTVIECAKDLYGMHLAARNIELVKLHA